MVSILFYIMLKFSLTIWSEDAEIIVSKYTQIFTLKEDKKQMTSIPTCSAAEKLDLPGKIYILG